MIERKHKVLIKYLASKCFEGQTSDEIVGRVQKVACFFRDSYSRKLKAFIKYFMLCLQKEFNEKYFIVRHSGQVDLKNLEKILLETTSKASCQFILEECPELIGGLKIQKGDNVWDFTIKGQLQTLVKILK